jgi:hypothetical protein
MAIDDGDVRVGAAGVPVSGDGLDAPWAAATVPAVMAAHVARAAAATARRRGLVMYMIDVLVDGGARMAPDVARMKLSGRTGMSIGHSTRRAAR